MDEHPHPFHMQVPLPPPPSPAVALFDGVIFFIGCDFFLMGPLFTWTLGSIDLHVVK